VKGAINSFCWNLMGMGAIKIMTRMPRVVGARDAAKYIGASTWTIRKLARTGELPVLRYGCFYLFVYAATATVIRLLLCSGSYTSPLTHR
jgi:hypothetical protein